ncbi:DoxX family protein [Niastella sp. OAS944]|uniref:DoxX family protein n=1 Tax=Niastella sp. OAS944 TaxID=2664089 RepID=UPI00349B1ADB|nr:putative membrane protein [Chitinophagaceae bacterium OAS944]
MKASKMLHVSLWIVQIVLAIGFIWASAMKLFLSADKLAAMWPWTAGNGKLTKVTGVLDLLAGIGLVLPALLRTRKEITVYAAWGTILLMVAASIFHIIRGEASLIGVNIFFAVMAALVAWGRRYPSKR